MRQTRRRFLTTSGLAGKAGGVRALAGRPGLASAGAADAAGQPPAPAPRLVDTPVLTIAYEESGDRSGVPVVLLHGFPDDVRAWDEVAAKLAAAGHRALVPYLRGYGPTRFRDPAAPRMAE